MKTVAFRTNLGSLDARNFGLDHTKCLQGDFVEVSPEVADALVKAGIAVLEADAEKDPLIQSALGVPDKKPEPTRTTVRGVAKKPEVTAPAK